jgi:hypothetical protein
MSQSSSKIEAFPAASVLNGVRCLLDFQQASQLDDVGLASTCKHKQIEITLKHLEARDHQGERGVRRTSCPKFAGLQGLKHP